jgi:2-C-methyl-D-erythritol 4-phosphate cytidylyltransferase
VNGPQRPSPEPKLGLILAAGGTGSRFGRAGGKQLAPLRGRSVMAWSLGAFLQLASLSSIVVVVHPEQLSESAAQLTPLVPTGVTFDVVVGGDTRQHSVMRGLEALPSACDLIAVHDGARPLLTEGVVSAEIEQLESDSSAEGVVLGHPCVDTFKHVRDGVVVSTPDRTLFWSVQTPQIFRAAALRLAYERADVEGFAGTDDASLVERLGGRVLVVEGPRDNLKVTHAEDLLIAEAVLAAREQGA